MGEGSIWLAVLAAAVAVWGWQGSPPALMRRLAARRTPSAGSATPRIPLRLRVGLGAGLAAAIGWTLSDVLGWWAVVVGAALLGGCVWGLGRLVPGWVVRERARVTADLPGALDLMRAVLEAGLPLQVATAAVADALEGPLAERLRLVLAHLRLGGTEADAWRSLADDPVLHRLARDLTRTVSTGAGLTALLDQHADEAREVRAGLVEQRARAVGVRTVLPLMCCYLPAFLVVGILPIVAGFVTGFLH